MKSNPMVFKMAISFAILISVLLGLGGLGWSWMERINTDFESTIKDQWAHVKLSREALDHVNANYEITMEILILDDDKAEIDRLLDRQGENAKKISDLLKEIKGFGIDSGRKQELINAVEAARVPYLASRRSAMNMLLSGHKSPEAKERLIHETLPLFVTYRDAWNSFTDLQVEEFDRAAQQSQIHYARTRILFLFLIVSCAILAISIAVPVTIGMNREIARREKAENEVGDLNLGLEQNVTRRTSELSDVNRGLAKEIADRKRAEENYRESSELVRLLLDSTAEAIYGIDMQGNCTLCNAACLRL